MYYYNFTNDWRISTLDEVIKEAGIAWMTDTVPKRNDDKSKHNNYSNLGFYFNLKAKGNCAKLAQKGNTKKVILNFIKKFQFPNPHQKDELKKTKEYGILISPFRDTVKLIHLLGLIDSNSGYLTNEEIANFIYFNDDLAKRKDYNLVKTANQILEYRKTKILPNNINTNESEHEFNQPIRQIREVNQIFKYSGCIEQTPNCELRIIKDELNRDIEADLFEIINYNSYWTGTTKEEWQEYMDKMTLTEDDMSENKTYNGDSLNRIIFGAPGTGKSHKLEKESEQFTKQEIVKTDISQQIKDEINAVIKLSGKLNFLGAIGVKFADYFKTKSRKDISSEFNISNVDELYIGSRAKEIAEKIPVDEEAEDKEEQIKSLVKQKLAGKDLLVNLMAIGIRFSDYLCTSSMPDLKKTYELKSDAQMWWLYRGAQAIQVMEQEPNKQPVKFLERVTFHPNYSFAQFVGTYKPVKSPLNPEDITYEYVPGPFMKVYVNAKKNPDKKFLLLIEEINRANVAAVFGDVFQLLDRKSDGTSEYPISASEDQKLYLESYGIKDTEITIPSNMYIWATMNSADQGVLPMDAAFKRRWDFEYIGIDENENWNYVIPLPNNETIKWNVLRKAINDKLKKIAGVNEDKLLGPYFISKSKLDNIQGTPTDELKTKFIETFKSKVLMYLFEDVCKMRPTALFEVNLEEGQTKPHYSDICKAFEENGIGIFGFKKEDIEAKYKEPSAEAISEQE